MSMTSTPLERRERLLSGWRIAVLSSSILTAVAGAQTAQSPPSASSDQLEEVVVNAQRRQQNLQDVPIVVEAFSALIASSPATRTSVW
jgi:outer membrane receptor protein involved in Fe transport